MPSPVLEVSHISKAFPGVIALDDVSLTVASGEIVAVVGQNGRGTYAARSSMVGGSALRLAAEKIIERCRPMAADLLEAAGEDLEFANGSFAVVGTQASIPLTEVAKAFFHPRGITDKHGVGLDASGTWSTEKENFPNGCHVCEVEVDPHTGEVTVDRYVVVEDVGVVINPMIAEGQTHGALAQGLGQALVEHHMHDSETGQLLTPSMGEYGVPRAVLIPDLITAFECTPCTTNPLGVKGVGEGATIGAPPAIINAVIDAVRPLGVTHLDMPATPDRVWQALQDAQSRPPDPADEEDRQ